MAKPNYSFEKRQRELAKKKKKEAKRLKKAGGNREQLSDDIAPLVSAGEPIEGDKS